MQVRLKPMQNRSTEKFSCDVSRNLGLRERKFVPSSACAQPSQYCVTPRCAHVEYEAM